MFSKETCHYSAQSPTAFPGLCHNFKKMSLNKYAQNINCVYGKWWIYMVICFDGHFFFIILCKHLKSTYSRVLRIF